MARLAACMQGDRRLPAVSLGCNTYMNEGRKRRHKIRLLLALSNS